jgi:hypothetical protein
MPMRSRKVHANSAYATITLLTILSSPLANAKDLAKVFMFNASRCGLTAKSRKKLLVWSSHTISQNFSVKSAKNLSPD